MRRRCLVVTVDLSTMCSLEQCPPDPGSHMKFASHSDFSSSSSFAYCGCVEGKCDFNWYHKLDSAAFLSLAGAAWIWALVIVVPSAAPSSFWSKISCLRANIGAGRLPATCVRPHDPQRDSKDVDICACVALRGQNRFGRCSVVNLVGFPKGDMGSQGSQRPQAPTEN